MKTKFVILFVITLALLVLPVSADMGTVGYTNKTIGKATPVIDGKYDDVWQKGAVIDLQDAEVTATSVWNILYDDSNLYVCVKLNKSIDLIKYSDLDALLTDMPAGASDAVEFRISIDGGYLPDYVGQMDHFLCIVDNWCQEGMVYLDDNKTVDFKYAGSVSDDKKSAVIEMAFPLTKAVPEGTSLNFHAQLDIKKEDNTNTYAWTGDNFNVLVGDFKFGGSVVEQVTEAAVTAQTPDASAAANQTVSSPQTADGVIIIAALLISVIGAVYLVKRQTR